jgi:hypothetical protein
MSRPSAVLRTREHTRPPVTMFVGNPDRRGLRQLASGTQSLMSPVAGTVPGTEFGRSSCEPCGQPETLAAGRLGRAPRGASPNAFSKTCHFLCLRKKPSAQRALAAARWAFHRPLARQNAKTVPGLSICLRAPAMVGVAVWHEWVANWHDRCPACGLALIARLAVEEREKEDAGRKTR